MKVQRLIKGRTIKQLSVFFVVMFFLAGCNPIGDQTGTIEYPETGFHGDNLLRESEITIVPDTIYSMRTDIDGEANVKVVFPGLVSWRWYLTGILGWANIEPITYNGRIFFTDKNGISDMAIEFRNSGSMTIEIYENDSDEPVRTKVFTW